MKLYILECEGGYITKKFSGYECAPIEQAKVVSQANLNEIESDAVLAREAGLSKIKLVELTVAEGECVKSY